MINYIIAEVSLVGFAIHEWILLILSPIILLILFCFGYYFFYWRKIRKSDYDVNRRNARIKTFKKRSKNR